MLALRSPEGRDDSQDVEEQFEHAMAGHVKLWLDVEPDNVEGNIVQGADLWPVQHSFKDWKAQVECREGQGLATGCC